MCGLCGILGPSVDGRAELLKRMTSALAHRGPDESGTWCRGPVALGHRRLSIIDVADGHQPMTTPDGAVTLVFNGEVYNHRELRRQLEHDGYTFATQCDTEAVLHLVHRDGAEAVAQLDGMFALAVWDSRSGHLLLARDRLGQKPLVYTRRGDTVYFASELQSLACAPIGRTLDADALDEYLALGYVNAPRTIWHDVHKLPPGHLAVVRPGEAVEPTRYWSVQDEAARYRGVHLQEVLEELDRVLDEAVRRRLMSDVPLGAFLSGGIDSGLVVALMARHSPVPVKTFSIGFAERRYTELDLARRVARRWGTEHHEFIVEPDCLQVARQLVGHFGEPFADSSLIPTWYVSRQTRRHVTVALSGDGGDELFGGYERYAAMQLARRLRRLGVAGLLGSPAVLKVVGTGRGKSRRRSLARFLSSLSMSPAERYIAYMTIVDRSRRRRLLRPELQQQVDDGTAGLARLLGREPAGREIGRMGRVDLSSYLPGDLLAKADICGMSVGLEVRS
ncbi:MAG: asparagine synthase (glutamine-hydrolyzing), partial [Planctomycetota bacterium]